MIALVFTVCLWNSLVCKNETVDADFNSSIACVHQAQMVLAQWKTYHPRWNVTRYKCGNPEEIDKSVPIR